MLNVVRTKIQYACTVVRGRVNAWARAHALGAGKQVGRQAGQTLACCKRYKKSLLTLKLSHTCARDADLAIETML